MGSYKLASDFEPGAFKIHLKTWDHDFGPNYPSHRISPNLTLKARLASPPASAHVSTRLLHRKLPKTGSNEPATRQSLASTASFGTG